MHVTAFTRARRGAAPLLLALLLLPAAARAQRGIDARTFRPALDGAGIFGVDRAPVLPQFGYGFGLGLDYAQHPLRLAMSDAMSTQARSRIILDYQVALELGAQLGLTRWLELVASFPVSAQGYGSAYGQYGSNADPTITRSGFYAGERYTNIAPPNAAPGDARAGFKALVYRNRYLGLGAAAVVTIPFGDDSAFLGDSSYTFRPEAIVDLTFGGLSVAANLGAIVRQETRVYDPYDLQAGAASPRLLLDVGHELTAALGIAYRVVPKVALAAELQTWLPLVGRAKDFDGDVLGGLQVMPRRDVVIALAGGGGFLVNAHRRDDFRVFAGITWAPSRGTTGDRDGDGVPDALDRCPDDQEDRDGFQDDDGCPEPDNDNDGIADRRDRCPDEAEDRDGFQDDDGCPEPDNDRDGVLDGDDRCPNDPEDRDGFQDDDGCPDLDNDGDDIPDAIDRCPNEPETRNGVDDQDGCPEGRGEELAGAGPVDLSGAIAFEPRRASLSAAAEAQVARFADRLQAHPQLRRVRIEGHADNAEVAPARAQALSQARALAVREALIRRGVDPERLQAVAYGAGRPLDSHNSATARARNRRVELIVVEE